jgi:cathepsin B
MKAIILVALLCAVAFAVRIHPHRNAQPVVTQELVDKVNAAGLWTADLNKGSVVDGMTMDQARALCGAKKGGPKLPPVVHLDDVIASLPASFDARTQWPQCTSIQTIRDQSACGSCWAFAAVEAMSDRSCIVLKKNLSLSAGGMAFCCDSCGDGCNGGYPASAWQYWQDKGVVEEPCYPYPFPSCDHHIPGSKNPCPQKEYNSPNCPDKCTNKTWAGPAWSSDRHKGKSAYSVSGVQQIQAEIMKNGPVEAAFDVYADFLSYHSGVYRHTTGEFVGGHAVKILGWGVDNGTPYWIIANSWNPTWGNQGYFWMLRGKDECGIEDGVVAGIPLN